MKRMMRQRTLQTKLARPALLAKKEEKKVTMTLSGKKTISRYDILVLSASYNANPNGDPDGDNVPRHDPETGIAMISSGCMKRKARDEMERRFAGEDGCRILIKKGASMQSLISEVAGANVELDDGTEEEPEAEEGKSKKKSNGKKLSREKIGATVDAVIQGFIDIRIWGGVLAVKGGGQSTSIHGPVQFGTAESLHPVDIVTDTITRVNQTREDDQVSKGDSGTMGEKSYLRGYVLFRQQIQIVPFRAIVSGMTPDDLEKFRCVLPHLFDNDASDGRFDMRMEKIIAFRHDDPNGNMPKHKLFERVHVVLKDGVEHPKSFNDYEVTIDTDGLPEGITVEEWL